MSQPLVTLAAARSYNRIYLTTGPRQPEAKYLSVNSGYTPQFDINAGPETIGSLPFTKELVPRP